MISSPALAKQLIGMVSQQNTLDRQLTVWENLYFHGRLFGISAADSTRIADELLEQFQLAKWAKASVFALSGGMAQRLMVARAIFHRPAVLFLDEPTAGLDPQSRLALWEILGELNRDGQTILLTTHYMEEADQLCERVAIMDHGKILALDTPAKLKQSVDADTIVTVKADGDMDALAAALSSADRGRHAYACGRGRRGAARARGQAARAERGRRGRARWLRGGRPVGRRTQPRDRVHQPDRQGVARLMATPVTTSAEPTELPAAHAPITLKPTRSTMAASRTALRALILRDLVVLRKNFGEFVVRTIIQPFLLVFVFLYVFPSIGQGVGGGGGKVAESAFATVLVPGVVAISIMFQGIQAVALQLSAEFGYTREIEDRVQAPCPIWLVAVSKVLSGAVQGALAAVIVFPIAAVIHAPGVHAHLTVNWPVLLTLIPLACVAMTSLGLLLGTVFEPRNIGLMFGFVVLPLTFLGGTYYQWTKLAPVQVYGIHWLQIIVLVNPLDLRGRGDARRAHTDPAHVALGGVSRARRLLRRLPHARAAQLSANACSYERHQRSPTSLIRAVPGPIRRAPRLRCCSGAMARSCAGAW